MSFATAKRMVIRVNALGGERAMLLAMEKAGDIHFSERDPDWDDDDFPHMKNHASFSEKEAAGYEVVVVRRGYANTEGGSEYDADYGVVSCSEPRPFYDDPDTVDPSGEYQAAYRASCERKTLDQQTCIPAASFSRLRI